MQKLKSAVFQLGEGLYWCSKFPPIIVLTVFFFSWYLLWLRLEGTESLAFWLIHSPINIAKKMCRSGVQETMGILTIIMGSSLFYDQAQLWLSNFWLWREKGWGEVLDLEGIFLGVHPVILWIKKYEAHSDFVWVTDGTSQIRTRTIPPNPQ